MATKLQLISDLSAPLWGKGEMSPHDIIFFVLSPVKTTPDFEILHYCDLNTTTFLLTVRQSLTDFLRDKRMSNFCVNKN